jgi:hypothetical protein
MPRPGRATVGFCIAIIALAALVPGIAAHADGWLQPQWVLLPDETPVPAWTPSASCDEQPVPLLALSESRGPPPSPLP